MQYHRNQLSNMRSQRTGQGGGLEVCLCMCTRASAYLSVCVCLCLSVYGSAPIKPHSSYFIFIFEFDCEHVSYYKSELF